MPERRNAAADCGSSCVAFTYDSMASIEILVFLIGAAEIDIGRRLFRVSNRIHDQRVLVNRRLEVAAESRRDGVHIVRLGGRQVRAIRKQRHGLQQFLPRPVGESHFRVGFRPPRPRQRERIVDLERALQRLARLKIRPLANGAGAAVVPHDGLGRRHVLPAPQQTRREPRRHQRGHGARGDQRLESDGLAAHVRR